MVDYNVNLEGKTVLVTGAAGFIGSNLVKRLFHDVKCIKVIEYAEQHYPKMLVAVKMLHVSLASFRFATYS